MTPLPGPPPQGGRESAGKAPPPLRGRGWGEGYVPQTDDPGFGIYIHWPFCLSKCPYCDFNSHVREGVDHARFRRALLRELETLAARAGARRVTSVFFGGGTPSLMEPETVGALLDKIAARFAVASDVEVTLEANPTSVEAARFPASAPRASIAFRSACRRWTTRPCAFSAAIIRRPRRFKHSRSRKSRFRARASISSMRAPGRRKTAWREELARAIALGTEHLSLYQLTFEPKTPFGAAHARGTMPGLGEEAEVALYEATQELSAGAGLAAYEISNHARPGAECRHNLVYWRYGDYLGVGPGAHGRIGGRATAAIRAPEAWAAAVERAGHGLAEDEALSPTARGEEYLLMALRLVEGVDLSRYAALAGAPLDALRIRDLSEEGLLARAGEKIAATAKGRLVLNRVIEALVA